jgi:hypothetical protein
VSEEGQKKRGCVKLSTFIGVEGSPRGNNASEPRKDGTKEKEYVAE